MKKYAKRHYKRKPFKRKKGSAIRFMPRGTVNATASGSTVVQSRALISYILQGMGFRVGPH